MSVSAAEAGLLKMIKAAEKVAHPCVPADAPITVDGFTCPLVIGDTYVREDWYGDEPPSILPPRDATRNDYGFACNYDHAYYEEGGIGRIELEWLGGTPDEQELERACAENVIDFEDFYVRSREGLAVDVRFDKDIAALGGEAVADAMEVAAASLAVPCPGAEPFVPPEDAIATPTLTTIVLSGGPGEEPPAVGATVPIPDDEQHRIVIGGLDGEVIREEYLGDQATIIGYGPMARDAEGNWTVLVDVEVGTAPAPSPAPASPAPSVAPPSPLPSAAPSVPPAPSAEPLPPTSASPLPAPSATPAPAPSLTPAPEPVASPQPASSPTPLPPPELVGMPEALVDYVAGLEPEAAGAVRNLTDHLVVLGDELLATGRGEVTIPASDLAELRRLVPDLVNEVRPVSGSILVDAPIDILVTPVIGEDGLIEFRTNHLQEKIRAHAIVKALVVALNNYVVESGGVFRTIEVTPEGLTVSAERLAGDRSAL